MTVQEIVTRVRAAIDELMPNDSQFLSQSNDELNLRDVIIDKIGYALQHIIETAPLEKLGDTMLQSLGTSELSSSFSIDSDSLVGTLSLPADLLRIVEARLSSWSHFPLPEPDTSQVALMQHDRYAHGSWDRPVNILTYAYSTTNKRVLKMYCARTTGDTLLFLYIKKPTLTNVDSSHLSTEVSVPAKLEAAFIYQVAALSMVAFREDVAASLFQIADRYMNGNNDNEG